MSTVPSANELARLSLSDRLDLLDEVWASLEPVADELPVPAWHESELRHRLATMQADGKLGKPVEEVLPGLKPGP